MTYGKRLIKFVQKHLSQMFQVSLSVDGKVGQQTLGVLARVPDIPNTWSTKRQIIGFVQYLCKSNDIAIGAIDGYDGPITDSAYDDLLYLFKNGAKPEPWRLEEGIGGTVNTGVFPLQTQQSLFDFYGDVGQHQTTLECPYTMKLAWKPIQRINKFSCHEKVADAMYGAMFDVKSVYGIQGIKDYKLDMWGGCLNVRKVRGGSYYSTHSWGISMDFNPTDNQLRWNSDKASLAGPEYVEWWDIWEHYGFTSLGRAKNYDWMHLQAAGIA